MIPDIPDGITLPIAVVIAVAYLATGIANGWFSRQAAQVTVHGENVAIERDDRRDDFQVMIDNLQEEVDRHSRRIDQLEGRERIRDDYIQLLRQHISDGKPPPPPEWPEGLR